MSLAIGLGGEIVLVSYWKVGVGCIKVLVRIESQDPVCAAQHSRLLEKKWSQEAGLGQ